MTSINIEVTTTDLTKKPQKQAWYERRWSIFSSRKVSKQNSKKRKELASNSEVLSTTSNDSSKSSHNFHGSILSHSDPNCAQKDSASLNGASAVPSSCVECLLCLTSQPADEYPILSTCQHQTCLSCLRQYLKVEISESRVNLTCPACQEKLHPSDVMSILQDDNELLAKWEEFLLRRTLSTDPDCRWCPAPDCGFAVIAYGCASCPRLVCGRPGCNTEFCYHCRQEWHHNQTCDSAHLQRTKQLRVRTNSGAYSQGSSGNDDIKPCPKCGAFIVKMNDGSCNHMTCTVCDAEFCWLCLQEITDLHYLSPSGCTFWGKKPWSKKKKIIWQLGLLIGAPLGIALVAGVAVPAIMIGLPVWIGKKVVNKLRKANASRHQKNLAAVGAVTASILISPALAAVAVAIGVPVLLLYVYGVVPISLYRTGSGNGVKGQPMASNVAAMIPGLRFDSNASVLAARPMTQEEGPTFQPRSNQTALVNPSIDGGSVGGMTMGSLNISHGSNLDKLGRGDQDGASTMAMAGTSITGSISGLSAGFNQHMRGEISLKDTDQHSIQTHLSACSNTTGVTSVQIHVTDDVSLHSSTSIRSNVKRTYSSKRGVAKSVQKTSKGSSVPSTSSVRNSEDQHVIEPVAPVIQGSNCVLTIVDESPYLSKSGDAVIHEVELESKLGGVVCVTPEISVDIAPSEDDSQVAVL